VSLDLDKRQRAMLREMGVRVWQPATTPVDLPVAIDLIAANADVAGATGQFDTNVTAPGAAAARPVAAPARPPPQPAAVPTPAPPAAARSTNSPAGWQLGEAQLLYADSAIAQGARWLVLAESGDAALQAPPFQGDAGKLLDNMLRAARLQQAGAVLLAPLARQATASAGTDFSATLAALLERTRPDVVLVMGRLAAQALLQSTLPFGKLRGQVHRLHGSATVVTYDAPYLLRSPADKAKAWADLRLAMSLARPAA
jgi:uracil-DNA glycosylase